MLLSRAPEVVADEEAPSTLEKHAFDNMECD